MIFVKIALYEIIYLLWYIMNKDLFSIFFIAFIVQFLGYDFQNMLKGLPIDKQIFITILGAPVLILTFFVKIINFARNYSIKGKI